MRAGPIFLIFAAACLAVPAPMETIINNQTMECSDFSRGDECVSCEIPAGWASLGYDVNECPGGYAEVSAQGNCTRFRISRCCSEGHSGAAGDCDDVIVNKAAKQCAFRNESACATPAGWVDAEGEFGFCPADYEWKEDACGQAPGTCVIGALIAAFTGLAGASSWLKLKE